MTGIIFLLILFIWLSIAKQIPFLFIAGMKPGNKKLWVYRLLCLLCFLAPVADEIVGGIQFWVICQQGTKLIYDAGEVRGKKLLWVGEPATEIKNTFLPIFASPRALVDIDSGKHLIDYIEYDGEGGWLVQFIAFNSITKSFSCGAKDEIALLRSKLNIETIFE